MGTAARKSSTQIWNLSRCSGKSLRQTSDTPRGCGYWTKKEFGKPVERLPLPTGKDIPIVHRSKFPSSEQSPNSVVDAPKETPTDPEFLRIDALESRNTAVVLDGPRHKLVKAAEKAMKRVKPDENGLLHPAMTTLALKSMFPGAR